MKDRVCIKFSNGSEKVYEAHGVFMDKQYVVLQMQGSKELRFLKQDVVNIDVQKGSDSRPEVCEGLEQIND